MALNRPVTNRATTEVGRAAIEAINARGVSMEEAAWAAGVGRSTLRDWAAGKARARPYLAQRVIDAMEERK